MIPTIEATQVIAEYAGRRVLKELSVSVAKGELVAIVGPSGGGKTTFLRCLNGLARFQGGTLRVAGIDVPPAGQLSPREERARLHALRLKVGFVFQAYALFSHMTVLANLIEAPIQVKGVSEKEAREQAEELLTRLGVEHRRTALPSQLSGGEKQRVAIARALAMQPEILLLDEPTSALDQKRRQAVATMLREVVTGGTTVVMVTHELPFAHEVADRVITLRAGQLDTLLSDPPPSL